MGQAKARGSKEQRVAAGIEKRIAKENQARIDKLRYEASLTPEDKEKRHQSRMLLSTLLGLAAYSGVDLRQEVKTIELGRKLLK